MRVGRQWITGAAGWAAAVLVACAAVGEHRGAAGTLPARPAPGPAVGPVNAATAPLPERPPGGGAAAEDPGAARPGGLFEGTRGAAVLMYHDVTDSPSVYFDLSTAAFRRQMEALRAAGASVIPLAALYDHLRLGAPIPPRSVVLTFDDGYLGQYTRAYPILREFGYPATFFVPTGTVGIRTSRDHMSWEQLREIDAGGLVSVEAHTISHPDDLRRCADAVLERELKASKKLLEEKLDRPVRFLAYPSGRADGRVAAAASRAGYHLALTMGPGWARSPADSFFLPRFIESRLPEVLAALRRPELPPLARPRVLDTLASGLESGFVEDGQVRLRFVRGGRLSSARLRGRRDVPWFTHAAAAPAGLNGTFFSDARVNSTGQGIVGPVLARFGPETPPPPRAEPPDLVGPPVSAAPRPSSRPEFAPGLVGDRSRVAGRPLVLLSATKMAFLPFQPLLAPDGEGVERLLPGATDCFLAGAWLVHRGRPLSRAEMESFRLDNMFDFRPRAFVGIDVEGRPFLGASSTGNTSDRLAQTLAAMGLEECVLLDSGFSTSLTVGGAVLVSGIRRADMPARPVPHALLLHPVDPRTGREILVHPYLPPGFVGPPQVPSPAALRSRFAGETGDEPRAGGVPAGGVETEPAPAEPGSAASPPAPEQRGAPGIEAREPSRHAPETDARRRPGPAAALPARGEAARGRRTSPAPGDR